MRKTLRLIRPNKKYMQSYIRAIINIEPSVRQDEAFVRDIKEDIERRRRDSGDWTMWWLVRGEEYIGSFSFSHRLFDKMRELITWEIDLPGFDHEVLDQRLLHMGLERLQMLLERQCLTDTKASIRAARKLFVQD
jgi:hypothetical protein